MEKALESNSREYFELLFNVVPSAIFVVDKDRRVVKWNKKAEEITGYSAAEMIGKECTLFAETPCQDKCGLFSDEVQKPILARRCTIKIKDGRSVTVIKNANLLKNEKGDVIGGIESFEDITDFRQIEERLRETSEELEIRVRVRTAELTRTNEELRGEITERKRAEEMLKKSEEELQKHREHLEESVRERTAELEKAITRLKSTEESLQRKEEHFRSLIENIEDMVFVIDQDHNIIYGSPSAERVLGRPPEEYLNKNIFNFIHPDDLPATVDAAASALKNLGTARSLEHRLLHKDGSWRYFQTIGRSILDLSNKPVIIVTCREITDRKKAQDEAQALRQQIEFILGSTKTGLDIIDSDFNILYIDPEWAKIYGDPKDKKCYEYFMDRGDPCPACGIKKALETKKPVVSEEVLAKENNRPIQVTTIPFQTKDGKWLVAEVNVDISSRKKVEEELKRYREHLEELVKERTAELEREIAEHKKSDEERELLNKELTNSNKRLKQLSLTDPHTGLYNHRYLEEVIEAEFYRARRYAHALAIVMLDIDYFKSINDVYGLQFGDLVLKQFAKELKRMVRRYDVVIRFGGEEFIILSPGTDRPQTLVLAQRLLDALNLCNFGDKKHSVKLKLSFAVVSYPEDRIASSDDLINLADRILSKAKESGGNRVYSSEDLLNGKNHLAAKTKESSDVKFLKNKLGKLTKRANQSLIEAISAFAKTIELKDHYTGEHVENTVRYATEIARELNLSREETDLVKQASMLHDLGKIGISENILLKKSKLTKKEFEEIKKHPQIGADIIRPIHFLHPLIPFIFYHHERWDGKGYPTGIKGEEIPVGARIIAIADVYQALTSARPYRKAFSKPQALKIIQDGSGTQFDPTIVSVFLKILKKNKH
ncbi:MAG: PAS domain S-box protein [Candidatus Omnitrophica bacterium]|nr:PAS domain S-box protein [Candidatus Omnitrophota bacterium]